MVQSSKVPAEGWAMRGIAMTGAVLLRQVIEPALCTEWLRALQTLKTPPPAAHLQGAGPADRTVFDLHESGAIDALQVLSTVARSAAGALITHPEALGSEVLCHLGQSWVRHGRPPHSWHQDGALQFDFSAQARTGQAPLADALLPMRTCWLALTPCGLQAPSLEWVNAPTPALLMPDALADAAVLQGFGASARTHAVMEAGDTLVFDGALLHRTHLLPGMRMARTSLELRFFPAESWPQRVQGRNQAVRMPKVP